MTLTFIGWNLVVLKNQVSYSYVFNSVWLWEWFSNPNDIVTFIKLEHKSNVWKSISSSLMDFAGVTQQLRMMKGKLIGQFLQICCMETLSQDEVDLCDLVFFFFQNEATFPLVRKNYYKESLQGDLYTHQGVFLRSSSRRWDYLHSLVA